MTKSEHILKVDLKKYFNTNKSDNVNEEMGSTEKGVKE